MSSSWKSLLVMLLVAEALLATWIVRIQPHCEPCLPGTPCPPCISDDQRMLMMIGCLLPVGVLAVLIVGLIRERRAQRIP